MYLPASFSRAILAALLLLGSSLFILSESALAVACRDIQSVQNSADANRNTAMGGHVTQHILGMTPPPSTSQVGKTLFSSKGKYDAAWRQYQYIQNPTNCGGNQAQQTVPLNQLGIGYMDAYSCTQADAQGRCTQWNAYVAQAVFYGFILRNGTWILNTSFPIPAP